MSSANPDLIRLGFHRPLRASYSPHTTRRLFPSATCGFGVLLEPCRFGFGSRRCSLWHSFLPIVAMDESRTSFSTLLEGCNGKCEGRRRYIVSASDGEDSDPDLVFPTEDVDLSISQEPGETTDSSSTTADRFASIQQGRKRGRIPPGVMNNMGLIAFSFMFLLFFDWCSWRIVRLPLQSFYFTRPFSISAVLSGCAGLLYVPIVDSMKIHQVIREEGPSTHSSKRGTPTMGGLFFIPIGVAVARSIAGYKSMQVYGAVVATLAFAAIGLLDDLLSCMKSHNHGLPGWLKFILQVAVGTCFSFWLESTNISTPYNMKLLVPLPPPFGLVHLGKSYMVLTAFCFAAMGNGVNLTDGLDGLAGGVAALAFIGMSVAVLAICPDLAVFGASMAGACIGFLFHNKYRASIFMGDTGSLALGGALAAMAACTGMFFPLFISSGVFVMEVVSVILQVLTKKVTKRVYGVSRRLFRMAPIHHHFELCGWQETVIVASAYVVSCILALLAAYLGLISA